MNFEALAKTLKDKTPKVYLDLLDDLTHEDGQHLPSDIEVLFLLLVLERESGNVAISLDPHDLTIVLAKHTQETIDNKDETISNETVRLLAVAKLNSKFIDHFTSSSLTHVKTPLVLFSIADQKYLYFQKEFLAALAVGRALIQRKAPIDYDLFTKVVNSLEKPHEGLLLNPEQKAAVALAASTPFCIITGGPGTGKSSIVKYIIKHFIHKTNRPTHPEKIAVAAPTGKAARRLAEAISNDIEIVTGTIHQMLRYQGSQFYYNQNNPLEAELVIIDEVSMIDLSLMKALLNALPPAARLILLGDRNQLPPVGSGAMLSDLVPDFLMCKYDDKFIKAAGGIAKPEGEKTIYNVVFLTRNMREEISNLRQENSISAIANMLLRNDTALLTSFCKNFQKSIDEDSAAGCYITTAHETLPSQLVTFFKKDFTTLKKLNTSDTKAIQHQLKNRKVLTFFNDGPLGTNYLNQKISEAFATTTQELKAGMPIMITRNDSLTGLQNGDTGLVVYNSQDQLCVAFSMGEDLRIFSEAELPPWRSAWCITVHKSQGSEYNHVVVVLPDKAEHPMNYRELVYTAITRGRICVKLIGTPEVLLHAAAKAIHRENGYPFWEVNP